MQNSRWQPTLIRRNHVVVSFSNVMEKVVNSCHRHIRCDGKSKAKGHKFGFLEKGID